MNADIKPRGNYDDECERQLVESGAELVILVVLNGNKGNGLSVSGRQFGRESKIAKIPFILRDMANDIEAQLKQQAKQ